MNNKTAVFLAVFSLLLFFQTTFSQVEIKEEILLNESQGDEIESVTLTMPFYGKVYGEVINYIEESWLSLVKISAGGQTILRRPGCIGLVNDIYWGIENLPSGTPITITIYHYCPLTEANSWYDPATHKILYYHNEQYPVLDATSVLFSEQTPVVCTDPCEDCPELPECEYYDDYPSFLVLNLN